MYVITNRRIESGKGLDVFGSKPNPEGPNELRLLNVVRSARDEWQVEVIGDKLDRDTVKKLKRRYRLEIDIDEDWYGSLEVACELFDRARREKKSILFFVHGYNNDVGDVLAAAEAVEQLYGVIVVPFTWPANGGGQLSGAASYLSDKSDARASAGALNRAVGKIRSFHEMLTEAQVKALREEAATTHGVNFPRRDEYFTRRVREECVVSINLLCHSMGNYVLKNTLKSSDNATSHLVFDNICLVAADANNENHRLWVERLDARGRIYVVINENDFALGASRVKPGDEQKARLGHYTRGLDSRNACYIDLTAAQKVEKEHTYFKGEAVNNPVLKAMFQEMFRGGIVEGRMQYRADKNTYHLIE